MEERPTTLQDLNELITGALAEFRNGMRQIHHMQDKLDEIHRLFLPVKPAKRMTARQIEDEAVAKRIAEYKLKILCKS